MQLKIAQNALSKDKSSRSTTEKALAEERATQEIAK
jgi:hypothetical protein